MRMKKPVQVQDYEKEEDEEKEENLLRVVPYFRTYQGART
jgi:hypothetical protein